MYTYIFGILFIGIILFFIYKFYSKIDGIVKKYIIPSQHVKQIKQKMKDLESEKKNDENSYFSKIMEKIHEILYLPIDFLYKLMNIYEKPLLYNFTHITNKNI